MEGHEQQIVIAVATPIVLGIGAQWLAWKLRQPAILVLLAAGILVGPVTGYLRPDDVFGPGLISMVSLAVAVILFEGGLSLKLDEFKEIGGTVTRLTTFGALVTLILGGLGAWLILGLPAELAVLVGAILTVTGPTVIIPMLRHLRPTPRLSSILKWEGIVIDPIGAMLAVLAFEAVLAGNSFAEAGRGIFVGILATAGWGIAIGAAAAGLMMVIVRKFWAPDYLLNAIALMLVLAASTVANLQQSEAGLFAVTVMGLILANQTWADVRSIIEFKESLRTIFISALFVILAARIDQSALTNFDLRVIPFLLLLILIVRPASVWLSTMGRKLEIKEKLFLSGLAPRGIVAAAVTAVFALRLEEANVEGADRLVPIVFFIIVGTVLIYGVGSGPLARLLKVSTGRRSGVVLIGAHGWAREMGLELKRLGIPVLIVDTNASKIAAAEAVGLKAHLGSALDEEFEEQMELEGIGKVLALTSNDSVNALSSKEMAAEMGRSEVYQLSPEKGKELVAGRVLFNEAATYAHISTRYAQQERIWTLTMNKEMISPAGRDLIRGKSLPLFVVKKSGELDVLEKGEAISWAEGNRLVYMAEEALDKEELVQEIIEESDEPGSSGVPSES